MSSSAKMASLNAATNGILLFLGWQKAILFMKASQYLIVEVFADTGNGVQRPLIPLYKPLDLNFESASYPLKSQ